MVKEVVVKYDILENGSDLLEPVYNGGISGRTKTLLIVWVI